MNPRTRRRQFIRRHNVAWHRREYARRRDAYETSKATIPHGSLGLLAAWMQLVNPQAAAILRGEA